MLVLIRRTKKGHMNDTSKVFYICVDFRKLSHLKFIYSEKATKFYEISTSLLPVCTVDKSQVEISPNFVTFSE